MSEPATSIALHRRAYRAATVSNIFLAVDVAYTFLFSQLLNLFPSDNLLFINRCDQVDERSLARSWGLKIPDWTIEKGQAWQHGTILQDQRRRKKRADQRKRARVTAEAFVASSNMDCSVLNGDARHYLLMHYPSSFRKIEGTTRIERLEMPLPSQGGNPGT